MGVRKEGEDMTKAEELKILEKIEKLIEGTDYIATAFDGVIEDARTNIENDWGCSYRDRYEGMETKWELEVEARVKAEDRVSELEAENEHMANALERWQRSCEAECERYEKLKAERNELQKEWHDKGVELAKLKRENIELKAKLYDMMTA